MFYVLALKNITEHCVASYPSYLCVVYGEWVNVVKVSAWHLVLIYEHSHCTDSEILLFLFLLKNVLIVSGFG